MPRAELLLLLLLRCSVRVTISLVSKPREQGQRGAQGCTLLLLRCGVWCAGVLTGSENLRL